MSSQTMSVVVYRNPMEQAMWESGAIVPVVMSCVTFLVAFVVTYWAYTAIVKKTKWYNWKTTGIWATRVAFAVSGVTSAAALYHFI